MKTIINFFISLFTTRKSDNLSRFTTPEQLSLLQSIIHSRVIRTFQDSSINPQLERPVSAQVLEQYIKNHFVTLCHYRILDSALIEEFSDFFIPAKICANSTCFNGYLLVDGHNMGCAYENTVAVAVQHGELIGVGHTQLFGFHKSTVSAEYEAHAICWDKSFLHLYSRATGEASDQVVVCAWDNTHITGHDSVEITALGNSTYEIDGNATVIKSLRTDISENTPTSNEEEPEIWEIDND